MLDNCSKLKCFPTRMSNKDEMNNLVSFLKDRQFCGLKTYNGNEVI